MAEENKTVTGTVAQVNRWKKKPGYFLNLQGDQNEYYGFGWPKVEVNDRVTFEVKPGTDRFADKLQLVKRVKDSALAAEIEKPVAEQAETGDKLYLTRQEADDKKNELIVKEVCLKAAAEVVGHMATKTKTPPFKALTEAVITMTDRFYCYVLEKEEPEPPEVPAEPEPEEGE